MEHKRISIRVVVLLGILPFLNGCAAVVLTLFGTGAGVATGTSVGYTLDGFAYRTFTVSLPQVESATRKALNRMGIEIGRLRRLNRERPSRLQQAIVRLKSN